jgi:hypothetical protein
MRTPATRSDSALNTRYTVCSMLSLSSGRKSLKMFFLGDRRGGGRKGKGGRRGVSALLRDFWAGKKRTKKGRRSGGPALVAAARREQLEQALQELKVP